MHVKATVSGIEDAAHPDCRWPQVIDFCAPEETMSSRGGIRATVFQGETVHCPGHRTQDTDEENHRSADERMVGKLRDCSFYLINLFPQFQIPYLYLPPTTHIKELA